jgi:hypothetical protein
MGDGTESYQRPSVSDANLDQRIGFYVRLADPNCVFMSRVANARFQNQALCRIIDQEETDGSKAKTVRDEAHYLPKQLLGLEDGTSGMRYDSRRQ